MPSWAPSMTLCGFGSRYSHKTRPAPLTSNEGGPLDALFRGQSTVETLPRTRTGHPLYNVLSLIQQEIG